MKRLIVKTLLLLLIIVYNLCFAQIEQPYPPLNLVSIPTAGTLPRGSFTLESLMIKDGGIVPRLSVGFTDNFSFGVSFGIHNLIGDRKPSFNKTYTFLSKTSTSRIFVFPPMIILFSADLIGGEI